MYIDDMIAGCSYSCQIELLNGAKRNPEINPIWKYYEQEPLT